MELFNKIDINIFSLSILFIIFLNIRNRLDRNLTTHKLFSYILITNALILILDTITIYTNGRNHFLAREVMIFSTTLYYSLHPLPGMIWIMYVDFQIHKDKKRLKKLIKYCSIPVFINLIVSILGIFTETLFYIDKNNIYHRGRLLPILIAVCYSYFIYSCIQVIKNKRLITKKEYWSLIMFSLLPCVGGITQLLFYGMLLTWPSMSLSILIIFINIQNIQLDTDPLTGLYNRRGMNDFFVKWANYNKGQLIGVMIMDLNDFKHVNDTYGHTQGDKALEYTSKILKKTFRQEDFISRYGGDEFVIIIEVDEYSDLLKAVDRLKLSIEEFNNKKITPYDISISIGYDIFNPEKQTNIEELLNHIDKLMYKDKEAKKLKK